MNLENYLQNKLLEYNEKNVTRMIELYDSVPNQRLKKIFSLIHFEVNRLLKYLNERIQPISTWGNEEGPIGYYTAAESRELIKWIDEIEEILRNLKDTPYSYELNPYYKQVLNYCSTFLQRSKGSPIPKGTEKVQLIVVEPIFSNSNTIKVACREKQSTYNLKSIGEGSYAKVFKYKDTNYNKLFAVKRANKGLSEIERKRFKKEFEEMQKLCSPYIVEVYSFNEEDYEYTMEYMDETLYDYISKSNTIISKSTRINIINQLFRGIEYIHSKGIFHRDISFKNVLLKHYDDIMVVKISDFGLIKTPDSELTRIGTEIKGSLNDPGLKLDGFSNYQIYHETYALTQLIYFILTGKTNLERISDPKLKSFVKKGLNADVTLRYQSIDDMRAAIREL